MKAEELMIGDWVLKLCKGGHYIPVKVLGVIDGVVDCQSRDGKRYSIGEDGIKPIPLKKIHLTKNGFGVREGTDDMEFFYNDGYEIGVVFDDESEIYDEYGELFDKIPPSIYLVIEFAEKSLQMPIEYVHELQQAMSIMYCDKEIEL